MASQQEAEHGANLEKEKSVTDRPRPVEFDREILRSLQDPETILVGWGTGTVFRELSRLYPLPLAYLLDSLPELAGTEIQGLRVYPPEQLLAERPGKILVVIYTGSHDAVAHQIARMGSIPCVPAESLLAYPPLPTHRELTTEQSNACPLALEKAVIPQILRLRPGDRFAIHGASEMGRVVLDLCLARDRRPVVILDDVAAGSELHSVPVEHIEDGIELYDPKSVIFAGIDQPSIEENRVRRSLARVRRRLEREGLRRWHTTCRELSNSAERGTEWNIRWAEAREKLWQDAGPFPCSQEDQDRLRSLHNTHRGERIFLIGNGPSLNRHDLSKLDGEYTFGFNKIYLLYDRVSWRPTFYTAHDWRVTPDMVEEINQIEGSTLFVPERFRGLIRGGDDVYHYACENRMPAGWNPVEQRFAFDPTRGVWLGGSVVVVGLQLAFYMGFDPIVLIGCDTNYEISPTVKEQGLGSYGVTSSRNLLSTEDDDSSHFDPRYFGKGSRWHTPQIQGIRSGFRNCLDAAESKGRTILDATAGGKLNVFERIEFDSLFRGPKQQLHRVAPSATI